MLISRNGTQYTLSEREVFDAWKEQQYLFDKEDVVQWCYMNEGYNLDENQICLLTKYYQENQDSNLGIWDNIQDTYNKFKHLL